uniref:Uncharacterized protein n=1 Tax=Anguilla anguilla TaxID=7936 RepID=A0A0E9ULP8_ANGAN
MFESTQIENMLWFGYTLKANILIG